MKSQGGLSKEQQKSPSRLVPVSLRNRQAPCSTPGPIPPPPPPLQPTLAGHPFSLTQQAQACVFGVQEEAVWVHSYDPLRTCVPMDTHREMWLDQELSSDTAHTHV